MIRVKMPIWLFIYMSFPGLESYLAQFSVLSRHNIRDIDGVFP
jgi:hypothetical protein